jgi:hypothetical protein
VQQHPTGKESHLAKKTPAAVKVVVIVVIAIGTLVSLTMCGAVLSVMGDDPATTAQPTPAAVPEPSTPAPSTAPTAKSYASVVALRDAVVKAGYPCAKWERWNPKKDGLKYAKEAGACSDTDWFSIYADAGALAKQLDIEKADE